MFRERFPTNERGISLIEVILAGATFLIIVVAFTGAIISSQESSLRAGVHSRGLLIANEGLDAVRNIRDNNFAGLSDGTYGLALQNNEWVLSGASDTTDIFSRSVTITSVDPATKLIRSDVVWGVGTPTGGSVSLSTYLTDWMLATTPPPPTPPPPTPSPTPPPPPGSDGGEADYISVDVSGASLQGGQDGNKELRGIAITNVGPIPITIASITASWTNTNEIERIRLNTQTVWSSSGPGTPLGDQHSGTVLDIQDFLLMPGATANGNNFKFDLPMSGAQFTFTYTFIDGHHKTFTVF